MTDPIQEHLKAVLPDPPDEAVTQCRRRIDNWFVGAAPLIRWDVIETPLGALYLATSAEGLCRVELGVGVKKFLSVLDPMARTEHDATILASITAQFRAYFSNPRGGFDLPLDLSRVKPFQQRVLETIAQIPSGTVWTYRQVAAAMGSPTASRAVGRALATNPLMIVLPCHRVVGSDGSLHGYRGGLEAKQRLLQLEGAL